MPAPAGHPRLQLGSRPLGHEAGGCWRERRWQTLVLGLSVRGSSSAWGPVAVLGELTGAVPRRQALEAERLKNFQQLLQMEEEVSLA